MDIWIGDGYATAQRRILLLGESTYGNDGGLASYVAQWIHREVRDFTFARLFNLLSGHHTEQATVEQRAAFWRPIAFYNFVPGSIGGDNTFRPTTAHWLSGNDPLRAVVGRHVPDAVLVLGKTQADYSVPVLESLGIPHVVTSHPAFRHRRVAAELREAWHALQMPTNAVD